MNNAVIASTLLSCLAGTASGQTASLVFSHDDSDGIVDPGQAVRITVRASWTQGWMLGTFGGDAVATPDAGVASNPVNGFGPQYGSSYILTGQATLGSIRGYGAAVLPGSVVFPDIFHLGWAGVDALAYDWTAPASAGNYAFDFEFLPSVPSIYLYQGAWPWAGAPLAVPTTVTPTSLLVVPAPSSLAVVAAAAGAVPRRQRGWLARS